MRKIRLGTFGFLVAMHHKQVPIISIILPIVHPMTEATEPRPKKSAQVRSSGERNITQSFQIRSQS